LSKTLTLKGKVFSGSGEGTEFIRLPWVKKQIAEKLGFIPYTGTLNVKLTAESVLIKKSLENARAIEILPLKGFCRGRCFPAYFMQGLKCAIIIPEIENYPEDIIEVVAPVNLREKFKLKDGDMVEVRIMLD
jgi:riboflavin kinase